MLRPSEHIKISKVEKDPNKLESLYQLGLRDAKRLLADKQGWRSSNEYTTGTDYHS